MTQADATQKPAHSPSAQPPPKKDQKVEDLSDADLKLKDDLEMLVQRLQEQDKKLYKPALEQMRILIRSETATMTSVPKPLKFLLPHFQSLVDVFDSKKLPSDSQPLLADVLSILGLSISNGKRNALKYRLLGSSTESLGSWGHEYVRQLSAEVIDEFNHVQTDESETSVESLLKIANEMLPFFMKHNAEVDACDLALELELLDSVVDLTDDSNYSRVALYITSCAQYVPSPDDIKALKTAHKIYHKFGKFPEALMISIKLHDSALVKSDFECCVDPVIKKQLAFILGRLNIAFDNVADEQLTTILSNSDLSERFLGLARELDVLAPKTPEDIYKSHLENTRPGLANANVDSAKQNLASTFVNAFVNVGFGKDKLITSSDDGNNWIYKNKDHGMMSATASIGAIMLWEVEMGLTQLDKFLYSTDDNIKAGALLGIGIVNAGIRNESDPALALLSEYVENSIAIVRTAAIVGLGIAYSGSCRQDVVDLLMPTVIDSGLSMELSALAALSCALIFVGSCDGDISSSILQAMMERDEISLKEPFARYLALSLGLLFLGKQEAADVTLETLKVIEHPISKQAQILVSSCAYVATGNVLKVQEMLHECNEHLKEEEDDLFQAFATIGIGMIAMGEDIGSQMAMRSFSHLMHYGELNVRRAVPIALAVLCASNPLVSLLDTLSKYSHDNDKIVSMNAIISLGIMGAGTNNARLAQMFRQLASFYHKEPNHLFCVRVSQGLLHMGKGTVTINPFCYNRELMSPVAVAGLLSTLISFTDPEKFVLGKHHYLLYYLVTAIFPRFLITVDEELKPVNVTVRVGQAVDTVGQAGKPKTITGFQTHSTPVLLAYSERVELATEECMCLGLFYLNVDFPLSPVLEGVVILKKNPDYVPEEPAVAK